jgi:hypothetical protein
MSANQENVNCVGMRAMIVNSDGALTNLFEENSLMPNQLPVGVVQQKSNNGKVHEHAKLHPDAIGLKASFSLRFLPLKNHNVSIINAPLTKDNHGFIKSDFDRSLDRFIERVNASNALQVITLRYVRNLSNGAWLKANKINFDHINITIKVKSANEELNFEFNDHEMHRLDYENFDANEFKIAHYLERSLRGEQSCSLEISAKLYGDERFIYASENPQRSTDVYLMHQTCDLTEISGNYPFPISGVSMLWDKEIRGELQKIDTWDSSEASPSRRVSMKKNGLAKALFELDTVNPASDIGLQLLANIIHGFSVPLSSRLQ